MSDDERLGPLFRAAADVGAPAAAFDHRDVLAASRRIAARRRNALVTSAVLVLASVGIGFSVLLPARSENLTASPASAPELPDPGSSAESDRLFGDPSSPGTAGSEAADLGAPDLGAPDLGAPDLGAPDPGAPDPGAPDPGAADPDLAAPGTTSDSSGPGTAELPPASVLVGPPDSGTTGCADRQDPALRALLEQALPEVAGAPAAVAEYTCLPVDQRYLSLEVDDAGVRGLLGVGYLPSDVEVDLAPGAVAAPTASGGTVIVSSQPAEPGGASPFAVRLGPVLTYLASRL